MTGPSDKTDFRLILTAVTERPLTGWERQQLWQILERHPEWIPAYVQQCEIPGLLAELDAADLAEVGVEVKGAPVIRIRRDGDGGAGGGAARSRRRAGHRVASLFSDVFSRRKPQLAAAALSAAAFLLVLEFARRPETNRTALGPFVSGATGGEGARDPESPQETYERVSAKLPVNGSLGRPATKFNAVEENPAHRIRFDEQIRPVLSEHCFACHGPGKQKSGLRLDTLAGATADLGGHAAIVAGKPEASLAIRRIETADADDVMPPPDSRKALKAADKALLRQWIAEGATYQQHWAFVPPRRPAVPSASGDWSPNPIDAFVLARMRERGLGPNPAADRYELARRSALDVLGLPASPEQVEAFVQDTTAGDAYERYLDGLFASPHYGEHQARYWLDAARYGDTHGMHLDNYREMWPYRDWVIDAFNRNLPFDQFITEQIAGDLLDAPTESQRIATGFGRCNISTSEGGSIPEEVAVRYMVDRTETFSTVFLGLTAVCASCHDHKYDPITQKDFYALGAFFNNTTQPAMDGNRKDAPPVLVLPSQRDRPRWHRLMTHRQQLRDQMQRRQEALASSGAFASWASRMRKVPTAVVHPVASDGLALWVPFEKTGSGDIEYWAAGQRRAARVPDGMKRAEDAPTGRGLVSGGGKAIKLPAALALADDQPLTISVWLKAADEVKGSVILGTPDRPLSRAQLYAKKTEEEVEEEGNPDKPKAKRHRKLLVSLRQDGGVQTSMGKDPRNSISGSLPSEVGLPPSKWHHLVVRYSGSRLDSGISYWVDGEPRATRQRDVPRPPEQRWRIHETLEIGADAEGVGFSDLRIFRRYLSDDEVTLLGRVTKEAPLHQAPDDLLRQYHAHVIDPGYRGLARRLAATQGERDAVAGRSTTTMVMEERKDHGPRAWLLERGEYDKRKDPVKPAVFAVLPPLPQGGPRNRLGLARWLTMRGNPLVARVTVNRLWQQVFGTGLVRTTEDFGTMGERPSHPELLDWLAVELVDSGWDVKRLLRLMLTSAAYRQSAHLTTGKLAADPDNRLLARGPRIRLDAEVLRDQALAASGLLVPELGGSPVKPYQPAELWKVVAFVGSNTAKFVQDHGPKLYRRSVYSFWKRTSPPPAMTAFDAPSRESCTVRRERTNTPLQALVLLNDPQFVEAARNLAALAMRRHQDESGRAGEIFRRVRGRPADEKTAVALVATARSFRASFSADRAAAHSLLAVGESPLDRRLDPVELATWTLVSNTVFNRDDAINKN